MLSSRTASSFPFCWNRTFFHLAEGPSYCLLVSFCLLHLWRRTGEPMKRQPDTHCAVLLLTTELDSSDSVPTSPWRYFAFMRCSPSSSHPWSMTAAPPQPRRTHPALCFPAPRPRHHLSGCRSTGVAQVQLLQSVAENIRGDRFLQWTCATRCWICLSLAVNFLPYLGNFSATWSAAAFSQKRLHAALRPQEWWLPHPFQHAFGGAHQRTTTGASLVSLSALFPRFILSVACVLQEWPSFFAPFPGQFSCSCSLSHSFRVRCLFLSNSSYKLESHVPQMILSLIRRSFMSLKYMCMPEFSATWCKHLSSSLLLAFGI